MTKPFVLILIDENSRVRVLQTDGVRVGVVDVRIDETVTLFPEADEWSDILAAIHHLPAMSPGADDPLGSALAAIRRIRTGLTVVSSGPSIPKIVESA